MTALRPTRVLAAVLAFAALTACHHSAPTVASAPLGVMAAAASNKARDKACTQLLSEYQNLSWDYQKDRKQAVLDSIGATGSQIAVAPLSNEYQNLSWDYQKERKQALMTALSRLGQVASQPCNPGLSTGMQDQICRTFLSEYQNTSWDYQADRKKLLLDAIANTGSDLGIEALSQDYQNTSWDYQKDRKEWILAAITKLLGSATPCNSAEDATEAAKKPADRKTTPARQHLASILERDLAKAPAAHRKAIAALLAKL